MAKKELTPTAQAGKLLRRRIKLENEIDVARKMAGIPALETKLEKVKAELVEAMDEAGLDQVGTDGYHATLVRQGHGAMFIATDEDLRDLEIPEGRVLRSMRKIIRKKYGPFVKGSKSSEIWKRITKPVVIPEAVEEIVSEGLFKVDEIADAFFEKQKKPYARLFKD